MDTSNPGIHHLRVGDVIVTALNDGAFEAQTAWVAGVPAEACEALLRKTFRAVPPRITVSAFLVTTGGEHMLVDAGCGSAMGPGFGKIRGHLATLGVSPADVTRVMVTHAHIDHVCGLVDDTGGAYFPNAELVIHAAEPAFWLNPANEAAAPEGAKDGFRVARRSLAPYEGRIRTLTDRGLAAPGMSLVHLPGHTPGHSGWTIASGNDALLIWGDVVHLPGIQFPRPEAAMGFDKDIEEGRRSRARIFAEAAERGLRVAGMHLDFPCFGHVVREGGGYGFVHEVWRPMA